MQTLLIHTYTHTNPAKENLLNIRTMADNKAKKKETINVRMNVKFMPIHFRNFHSGHLPIRYFDFWCWTCIEYDRPLSFIISIIIFIALSRFRYFSYFFLFWCVKNESYGKVKRYKVSEWVRGKRVKMKINLVEAENAEKRNENFSIADKKYLSILHCSLVIYIQISIFILSAYHKSIEIGTARGWGSIGKNNNNSNKQVRRKGPQNLCQIILNFCPSSSYPDYDDVKEFFEMARWDEIIMFWK